MYTYSLYGGSGANQNDFTFKPISLKGFGTRVAVSGSQNVPYPAAYVLYEEHFEGRDVWSNQAILTPSPISNAGPPNFGQGLGFDGSTVIAGSNHDDAVGLHSGSAFVFTGSWTVWTQTQKLVPSDGGDKGFGYWVTDWASPEISPYVLISAPGTDDNLFYDGAVYSYTGFASVASTGQGIITEHHDISGEGLGPLCDLPVGVRASYYSGLVNTTRYSGLKATKAFSSSVTYPYWSQLQRIVSVNAGDQNFGKNMRTYSNIAVIGAPGVGGAFQPTNAHVYIYLRDLSTHMWTYQEVLAPPAPSQWGEYLDIYGEYIVIGLPVYRTIDYNENDAGVVYIYKQTVYTGTRVQYSLTQTLVESGTLFFGVWVSMYDDSLWVGAAVTGCTSSGYGYPGPCTNYNGQQYVYRVNSTDGMWHLSQQFNDNLNLVTPANYVSAYVWRGGAFVTDNSPSAQYYSQSGNWSCLIITMADQFGDGWSGAKLEVTLPANNPAGTQYFAPYCDTNNPYQLEFCPPGCAVGERDTNSGLYTFSILNGSSVPFFWEISWSLYVKGSAVEYKGNYNTSMTFQWNCITHSFTFVSAVGLVPVNQTCEKCASKPDSVSQTASLSEPVVYEASSKLRKSAPSHPRTKRQLLQYSPSPTSEPTVYPTPTPTVTPSVPTSTPTSAPTIFPSLSATRNLGRWLTLYDATADGWFDGTGLGSQYFISDITGSCLIHSGTLCPEYFRSQCWQTLPEGEYMIRFGGGADVRRGSQTWDFCGMTGGMQEQLVFRIVNDSCTALGSSSSVEFCQVRTPSLVVVIDPAY